VKRAAAILLLLPLLVSNALANAMPAYIEADPGLELAVDEGCPIVVEHEDLTFDLSGDYQLARQPARVTASYLMTNPSDETQTVMMAFPYVVKLGDEAQSAELFSVTDDGVNLEYDIYYGRKIKDGEDLKKLEYGNVLLNVMLESPPEPDDGLMYKLIIDTTSVPDDIERIYIRMSLTTKSGKCFTSGFSGGTFNSNGTSEVNEWLYLDSKNASPMSVFVSGGSLESYSAAAYKSYDSEEPIKDVNIDVDVEHASFRDFAYESFNAQEIYPDVINDKIYWALLGELNNKDIFASFNGVVPLFELLGRVMYDSRLAVGVFNVNFEPNASKNITVRSSIDASIRRPTRLQEVTTKYTYTYLSNPAKSWAGFGTLNITVIPPQGRDFAMTDSEPELTLAGDGIYKAELEGLPPENIQFTFEEKTADLYHILGGDWLVVTFIVIISTSMAIIFMRMRRMRRLKSC